MILEIKEFNEKGLERIKRMRHFKDYIEWRFKRGRKI